MDKIYRHILQIHPDSDKPVGFSTVEYLCHNFDSKTAKNFVIQIDGEREKRHLDRDRLGKVSMSQSWPHDFMFSVYFLDNSEEHRDILRETAEKRIGQHLDLLRLKVQELEKIKLDF
jgi:hypothetical protein